LDVVYLVGLFVLKHDGESPGKDHQSTLLPPLFFSLLEKPRQQPTQAALFVIHPLLELGNDSPGGNRLGRQLKIEGFTKNVPSQISLATHKLLDLPVIGAPIATTPLSCL
jgi:hypothetical protein